MDALYKKFDYPKHWRQNVKDKPAFPFKIREVIDQGYKEKVTYHHGMTLREYYAGLAMRGLLPHINKHNAEGFGWDTCKLAECAVEQADALIAELQKEQGE